MNTGNGDDSQAFLVTFLRVICLFKITIYDYKEEG